MSQKQQQRLAGTQFVLPAQPVEVELSPPPAVVGGAVEPGAPVPYKNKSAISSCCRCDLLASESVAAVVEVQPAELSPPPHPQVQTICRNLALR